MARVRACISNRSTESGQNLLNCTTNRIPGHVLGNNGLCLHTATPYVLLFLVLVVNSHYFQILQSYTISLVPFFLLPFHLLSFRLGKIKMCHFAYPTQNSFWIKQQVFFFSYYNTLWWLEINSSTLGRLGAVTLAAAKLDVQTEEAQKLVQLSGIWNI